MMSRAVRSNFRFQLAHSYACASSRLGGGPQEYDALRIFMVMASLVVHMDGQLWLWSIHISWPKVLAAIHVMLGKNALRSSEYLFSQRIVVEKFPSVHTACIAGKRRSCFEKERKKKSISGAIIHVSRVWYLRTKTLIAQRRRHPPLLHHPHLFFRMKFIFPASRPAYFFLLLLSWWVETIYFCIVIFYEFRSCFLNTPRKATNIEFCLIQPVMEARCIPSGAIWCAERTLHPWETEFCSANSTQLAEKEPTGWMWGRAQKASCGACRDLIMSHQLRNTFFSIALARSDAYNRWFKRRNLHRSAELLSPELLSCLSLQCHLIIVIWELMG